MKTILVPIDFTETAQRGLDYALMFGKPFSARIVLLNAWNLPETHPSMALSLDDVMKQNNEKAMKDLVENIKSKPENKTMKLDAILETGNIVTLIKNSAKKMHADIIIMGTEGAEGFQEVFLGSNTGGVMEQSPCPVLAVPQNIEIKAPKKIAFASNFETKDLEWLKTLISWFKPFAASFSIIHIGDPNHKDLNDFENFVLKAKRELHPEILDYEYLHNENIQQGIQDYIDLNQIDLISMSARKHTFFQQLFNRSLTKRMAYHTSTPLLAFPPEKKQKKSEKKSAITEEVQF